MYRLFAIDNLTISKKGSEKALWSDETTIKLYGINLMRKRSTKQELENRRPTVKQGGRIILFWGCFYAKAKYILYSANTEFHKDVEESPLQN